MKHAVVALLASSTCVTLSYGFSTATHRRRPSTQLSSDPYSTLAAEWAQRNRDDTGSSKASSTTVAPPVVAPPAVAPASKPSTPTMADLAAEWAARNKDDVVRPEPKAKEHTADPFSAYMTVSNEQAASNELRARLEETAPAQPPASSMEDLAAAWASMTRGDDVVSQVAPSAFDAYMTVADDKVKDPGYIDAEIVSPSEAPSNPAPPAPVVSSPAPPGPSMEDLARQWASMSKEKADPNSAGAVSFSVPQRAAEPVLPKPSPAPAPAAPSPTPASPWDDLARQWGSMTSEKADPNSGDSVSFSAPPVAKVPAPAPAPAVGPSSMDDLARAWSSMSKEKADPNSATSVSFTAPSLPPKPTPSAVKPPAPAAAPAVDLQELAQSWMQRIQNAESMPEKPPAGTSVSSTVMDNMLELPKPVVETMPEPIPPPVKEKGKPKARSLIEQQARSVVEHNVKSLEELTASWTARTEDKEEAKLASFYKPKLVDGNQVDEKKKRRVRPAFLDNLGRVFSADPQL